MATYTEAFPINGRMSQVEEIKAAIDRLLQQVNEAYLDAIAADPDAAALAIDWTSLRIQTSQVQTGFAALPSVLLAAVSVDAT